MSLKTHMIVIRGASPNYGALFTLIFLAGKEEKYPISKQTVVQPQAGGASGSVGNGGRGAEPWRLLLIHVRSCIGLSVSFRPVGRPCPVTACCMQRNTTAIEI